MTSSRPVARIAISAGEPAGIGPDVVLAAAGRRWDVELVVVADRQMLEARAARLGLELSLHDYLPDTPRPGSIGSLSLLHTPLAVTATPGVPHRDNAAGVLAALDRCVDGCVSGEFAAMVTAPVNKSVICDSGVPFSGHTEYLAERTGTQQVVMLLAAGDLRVALASTHIPLSEVPRAITTKRLLHVLRVMHADLQRKFGIAKPRISVLGLNPHAGEGGHLGREDMEIIAPAIDAARGEGIAASGPWPADTAFNQRLREQSDAYLAMYHDQGLPVLKYASFGAAVNITLGLPIIRSSVDHGTAFDLAGSGEADSGSFIAAVETALQLIEAPATANARLAGALRPAPT